MRLHLCKCPCKNAIYVRNNNNKKEKKKELTLRKLYKDACAIKYRLMNNTKKGTNV